MANARNAANKNAAKKINYLKIVGVFTPIIVAVVGCAAAVVGAEPFATWMVNLLPSMATPTPIVQATVPATRGSLGATPIETQPFLQEENSVAAPGQDWLTNCISSQWVAYPSANISSKNNCLQEPIWGSISTRNGGLYIFAQPSSLIATKEYGVFVQLPQNAVVRANVDLDSVKNGQIWFGVLGEPTISANGTAVVASAESVTQVAFAVKDTATQRVVANSKYYENSLGVYSLGFDVSNGVVTAIVENDALKTVPFVSPRRWLFIGYRANLDITNGSADIQALFSNLTITQ